MNSQIAIPSISRPSLLAGDDQRAVAADLREDATRAYDLLERGLAGYGLTPA